MTREEFRRERIDENERELGRLHAEHQRLTQEQIRCEERMVAVRRKIHELQREDDGG